MISPAAEWSLDLWLSRFHRIRIALDAYLLRALWRRIVFLAVTMGIAALTGWAIGTLLWSLMSVERDTLRATVGSLTLASVVLAVYKVIAANARTFFEFIVNNRRENVLRLVAELIVAFAVAGVAFNLVATPEKASGGTLLAFSLIRTADAYESGQDRIVLPFFPGKITNTRCDPRPETWGGGEKLADEYQQAVVELGCALRACSGPTASVEIDVRGFASSREFASCSNSAALNLALAEERRRGVIRTLRQSNDSAVCRSLPRAAGAFRIIEESALRWNGSYESMEEGRIFNDRPTGEDANRDRETLTRRVDIVIASKGECGVR